MNQSVSFTHTRVCAQLNQFLQVWVAPHKLPLQEVMNPINFMQPHNKGAQTYTCIRRAVSFIDSACHAQSVLYQIKPNPRCEHCKAVLL